MTNLIHGILSYEKFFGENLVFIMMTILSDKYNKFSKNYELQFLIK